MVLQVKPTSGRSEWDGKPQRVQNKEERTSGLKDRRRQQGLGKWLGHRSACGASMKAPVTGQVQWCVPITPPWATEADTALGLTSQPV